MKKNIFLIIFCVAAITFVSFCLCQNVVNAQLNIKDDAIYMFGSIERDKRMSGFFSQSKSNFDRQNQCVFIGKNGKVYRLTLTEKNIVNLFIDGKKVEDSQIWKYTAEYKPFLMKFWRQQEIETEIDKFEKSIKPFTTKIEEIDKQIVKIEQESDKISENKSNESAKLLESLKTKIRNLRYEQKTFETKISDLENNLEKFDDELESLNLHGELEKVLEQIKKDLASLGAIKNRENLSYKLSNKELIVNGKKISEDIFNLLKTRYVFESLSESGFVYRWKSNF